MKKKIKIDFFSESRKWNRRLSKIKNITKKILSETYNYFSKKNLIFINIILSDEKKMTKLNKKYKNINKDTDVLTFVTKIPNKALGKNLYCDIFFSIDTIETYIKKNNINLYDHFSHLLIHSFLHINGYDHKNEIQFKKMKAKEIEILKNLKIKNPYIRS